LIRAFSIKKDDSAADAQAGYDPQPHNGYQPEWTADYMIHVNPSKTY